MFDVTCQVVSAMRQQDDRNYYLPNHSKIEASHKCLAQGQNQQTCQLDHHCPINAEHQAVKL